MAISEIHVQTKNGKAPKGTKVALCFRGLMGGMTNPVFTDADGIALVEHASSGWADIYVSGKKCGSVRAPGRGIAKI